jgi:hypothetical protein
LLKETYEDYSNLKKNETQKKGLNQVILKRKADEENI